MFDEINLFLSPLDFTPSSLFFAAIAADIYCIFFMNFVDGFYPYNRVGFGFLLISFTIFGLFDELLLTIEVIKFALFYVFMEMALPL